MKKAAVWVSGFIVGAVLSLSTAAYGSGVLEKVDAYLRPDFKVSVDGAAASLKNAPLVYDGSTYLPVREMAEVLNKTVNWNEETMTAELNSKETAAAGASIRERMERESAKASGLVYNGDVSPADKIEGLDAITYEGVTYFSRDLFLEKFRTGDNSRFKETKIPEKNTNGIIFYDKAGVVAETVTYPGKSGFMIVTSDGRSWISTEYYPDEAPFRN